MPPPGNCQTTMLRAGLHMNGLVAPMVPVGPINAEWFETHGAQVLVLELQPGDVVVIDNLSTHKRGAERDKI